MTELIGWIGAVAFATSVFPQVFTCIKQGHARGLSDGLLVLWFVGEVCTLAYVALTTMDIILLSNYILNLIGLCIVLKYRLYPTKD